MCSISRCLRPVSFKIRGISQGFFQSMEKCMVPTLSRWQMDP